MRTRTLFRTSFKIRIETIFFGLVWNVHAIVFIVKWSSLDIASGD